MFPQAGTRRSSLAALAALVVAAVLPATANASIIVSIQGLSGSVVDTAGTDDELSISGDQGQWTVTSFLDEGLVAGPGCTGGTEQVVCGDIEDLTVSLAGGGDLLINQIAEPDGGVTLKGEGGNDVIATEDVAAVLGGDGDDNLKLDFGGTLLGEGGNDTLTAPGGGPHRGGPGNDRLNSVGSGSPSVTLALQGEDGDDVIDLSPRRGGPDNVSGGPGIDQVQYSGRSTANPVAVTLDAFANDGSSGEGDTVQLDVEKVVGTSGNDSLVGSANPDRLFGLSGNDLLAGVDGSDLLGGGFGNDLELGGAGNDKLGARNVATSEQDDPGADTFAGEGGRDEIFANDGQTDSQIDCGVNVLFAKPQVAHVDLVDPSAINCAEQRAPKDQHPTVQLDARFIRVKRGFALVRLRCPRRVPGRRCAGTVAIARAAGRRGTRRFQARGRALARARYRLRAGTSRRLKLRMRVRLRRRARVRAVVLTRERDPTGRPKITRTPVLLRR